MKNSLMLLTKSASRLSVILIAIMVLCHTAIAQPTFTGGSPQTLTVCQNSSATSINTLLSVADPVSGSTETWSTASGPTHGTLVASYSTTSTGSTLTPAGLTYVPTAGYSGTDAFTVHVSNGTVTASTTINVTVTALPAAIGGGLSVCTGATINLTDGTVGGVWSSTNTGVATISASGVTGGISAGTSLISYTKSGCSVTATVTDKDVPVAIAGTSTVCVGSTITLTDMTANGAWSSSSAGHASVVAATGVVTGVAQGAATISYSTGCGSAALFTVTAVAAPAVITGATSVCNGANTTLSNTSAGGIWTSGTTSVATIGATGILTGMSAGTTTVTYATGCGSNVTYSETVKIPPTAISGMASLCIGSTVTMSDAIAGGAWSSSNTAIATVDPVLGIVTGIAAGAVNINYATGCGANVAKTITVTTSGPAAITGVTNVCIGATTTLADATAGGTWSVSNPVVATIGATGIVTGISANTVTVNYTIGCGTDATVIYTVKDVPVAIAGSSTVCVGSTITMTDATAYGAWSSSSAGHASVVAGTGVVTGVAQGAATISYSTGCGSAALFTVTAVAAPAAITGATSVCNGANVTLSNTSVGGIWTSSDPTIATNAAGVFTGVAAGTVTVTYNTGCGSNATYGLTVKIPPTAISGMASLCIGSTVTMSDAIAGGAWSSSNTAIATVDPVLGIVTGIAAGAVNINYATGCGANVAKTITVTTSGPAAITGVTNVCIGATTTLADATAGGTWSVSDPSIATIGATGIVTGITANTVTVNYTIGCGTDATVMYTVKDVPAAISGASTVCIGSATTLADATAYGAWTSSNGARATIGGTTGVVTGVAAGALTMTYSTGCGTAATYPFTVIAAPAAITGATSVCNGANVTLSNTSAGGTWSSSDPTIATNAAGVFTGVAAGTVTVTYNTGCGSNATYGLTVKIPPAAISGMSSLCIGTAVTMSDAVAGGAWTSSNTAIATVDPVLGIVSGIAAGGTNINYSTGCGANVAKAITVTTSGPAAITGVTNVCIGANTSLADATAGGIWSSANTGIATVSATGIVTGIAAGTTVINYTIGCGTDATTIITVKDVPTAISGAITVCIGATISLTDGSASGAWTSNNTGRATIGASTGLVTGVAVGAVTMTYNTGCGTAATLAMTVVASPAAITGVTNVCVGANTTLANTAAGGTWSTGNTSIATNAAGVITGVSAGTVTITYSTGCGSAATAMVTVKSVPVAIAGTPTVCVGSTITLTDVTAYGAWTSSNTARATIGAATGIVGGVAAGALTMTYSTGCGTAPTYAITVVAAPVAIAGATSVCNGATTTLTDASAGGVWTSSATSVATIGATGILAGRSSGTTTVTYATGCGSAVTYSVTVKIPPTAVSGLTTLCTGSVSTFSDAISGGAWTSSNTAIATVDPVLGIVNAIAVGSANIVYSTGCNPTASKAITVNLGAAAIAGATSVCTGANITLTDATAGGTWSSSNTALATVSTAGIVTGRSAGVPTITYGIGCGTGATYTVTVKAVPVAVSGSNRVCLGGTTSLTDATASGAWTSSNTARATVGSATGIVYGVAAGAVNLTYSTGCGTAATLTMTVYTSPAAIGGAAVVCNGSTITLTDATAGGTWTSGSPTIGTVSTSGVVGGISSAGGTTVIGYSTGCGTPAAKAVTVNIPPAAISGPSTVCVGSTITLTDAVTGGAWTSSSTGKATVVAGTGVVTGVTAGALTITYSTGCGTTATHAITVLAAPAAIAGAVSVCTGASTTLTNTTAGGTWSGSNTSVATNLAGAFTGITAGTITVTYSTGCGSAATKALTVKSSPTAITGTLSICAGATTALSDAVTGGAWSSSVTTKATINAATGVATGIAAGPTTITYNTGCGTNATATLTINTTPVAIAGTPVVCTGATTPLTDATGGGTWSSATPSIATISATGVVNGILGGSANISYTIGGCAVGTSVTVNTSPASISGISGLCNGSSTTFSDAISGGTWVSSSTGVATINASGVATGVSVGATVISYTTGCGTPATKALTINNAPSSITGSTGLCVSANTTLSNTVSGGTWSSSNTAVATVNSSGAVYGSTAGTTTISYTIGSCYATDLVTVTGTTSAITGSSVICYGSSATLSDATGGGAWTSSNTAAATVNSATGLVTSISSGTTTITYSTGCGTPATALITIQAAPSAISGSATVCTGTTTTLTDAILGGSWSSSNTGVASVNAATGVVSGIATGVCTISYSTGCGSTATANMSVQPTPTPISGATSFCIGTTDTLIESVTGGTWSSSNIGIATVDPVAGVVYGISSGISVISYSTGCGIVTYRDTVEGVPSLITGAPQVCVGAAITLSDSLAYGTWTTSDPTIATVTTGTGMVTGISGNTVVISYSTICGSPATASILIQTAPAAITGPTSYCDGLDFILSDAVGSGTWSSSNMGTAIIDTALGVVTTLSQGITIFTYSTGCGASVSQADTIYDAPLSITGTLYACVGATTALSDTTVNGVWSSSNPAVATVNAVTGVVTGISGGTSVISYATSCGAAVTATVSIQSAPAAIAGTTSICNGASTTLTDAVGGGSWSSLNTSVATIDSVTGIVTSLSVGTSVISYSIGCGLPATATVSVQTIPSGISGISSFCTGSGAVTFSDSVSGGTWSSSAPAVVTINPVTGIASGLLGGAATISYSLTNGCGTNLVTYNTSVIVTGTWIGATSTNWSDAGNWACGTIPDSTMNVIIPSGTAYSLILISNDFAKSIKISSGATVTINSGDTLNVYGKFTNNGVVSGSGLLAIDGSVAQMLCGKGFVGTLQINNAAGVSVNTGDTIRIKGTLKLTNGTLTTNNGVELASDSTGTGRIGKITGGNITGNVTIQQYIPGGRRAYRFWAHPFTTSIPLSQLEQYVDITGYLGSTSGFTTTTSNAPSSYWYNTAIGNSSAGSDPGWTAFTNTNGIGSNAFNKYEGMRLFIRGSKGQGLFGESYIPSPVTINMNGPVNTGNITMPMVKGSGANADFNLLGNPYPSAVDLGTVIYNAQTSGQVTGGAYYVWDPYMSSNGQFVTVPVDGTPYYIEANNSFEVRTVANGSVLSFAESNKSSSISIVTLRTAAPEFLTLDVYDTSYHLWDMLYVKFNDAATAADDDQYDGRKPSGPAALNFYSLSSDNAKLSLDARPYSAGKTIPLGIRSAYAQDFIIKADNMATTPEQVVYLYDNYLQRSTLMKQGEEYRFKVTADSLSQGEKRFELRMGSTETTFTQTATALDVKMMPNPATDEVTITYTTQGKENVSLKLLNVSGTTVLVQDLGVHQNGSAKIDLEQLASGIYMVELTSGTEKIVQRLVKE